MCFLSKDDRLLNEPPFSSKKQKKKRFGTSSEKFEVVYTVHYIVMCRLPKRCIFLIKNFYSMVFALNVSNELLVHHQEHCTIVPIVQGDSFGTRPKKMRISQRLFIRF